MRLTKKAEIVFALETLDAQCRNLEHRVTTIQDQQDVVYNSIDLRKYCLDRALDYGKALMISNNAMPFSEILEGAVQLESFILGNRNA